jgi:hypothetical protein
MNYKKFKIGSRVLITGHSPGSLDKIGEIYIIKDVLNTFNTNCGETWALLSKNHTQLKHLKLLSGVLNKQIRII